MTWGAGKSVLVTGGGSGIGRAAAAALGRIGARVAVADVEFAAARAAADDVLAAGGRAIALHMDVSREESVRQGVAASVDAFGGLDGAINSAGVPQAAKPVHELTHEEWEFCNGVNYRGMFYCVKHEVAAMLGGGGAIVAVSSAAATKGLFNSADYCASKAGVTGLVRAAAVDCAELGIRVNALLPGATATPLAARSSASNPKLKGTLRVPMARVASPDEIAAVAIWLLSDDASYVTGASIAADGGMGIA